MSRWRIAAALLFTAVLGVSVWQLWVIQGNYARESEIHERALQYKPSESEGRGGPDPAIAALQAQNGDAVGWLRIPGTRVDYPFVQAGDNDYYLRRDLFGESAAAGTIFMDCRCVPDFSGRSTIIYGHHMRNGSMFQNISLFGEQEYFDLHRTGVITLLDREIALEFFACAVVKADDPVIYSQPQTPEEQAALLRSLERQAKQWRDIGITQADNIVLLSTCSYQFDGARTVLAARAK